VDDLYYLLIIHVVFFFPNQLYTTWKPYLFVLDIKFLYIIDKRF